MFDTCLHPCSWTEIAAMKKLRGGEVHITSFQDGLFRAGIRKIRVKDERVLIACDWAARYNNGYWLGHEGLWRLNFRADVRHKGEYATNRLHFSPQQLTPPTRDRFGVIISTTEEYGVIMLCPAGHGRPLRPYDLV